MELFVKGTLRFDYEWNSHAQTEHSFGHFTQVSLILLGLGWNLDPSAKLNESKAWKYPTRLGSDCLGFYTITTFLNFCLIFSAIL